MAVFTEFLSLTTSFFASVGRGYLAAVGGLIGLIVAAQVAVLAGAGTWFPLSSPALWAANSPAMPSVSIVQLALSIVQLALVPVVSLPVASTTIVWWQKTPLV